MGNSNPLNGLDHSLHAPPLEEYITEYSGMGFRVWQHCYQKEALIEIPTSIASED